MLFRLCAMIVWLSSAVAFGSAGHCFSTYRAVISVCVTVFWGGRKRAQRWLDLGVTRFPTLGIDEELLSHDCVGLSGQTLYAPVFKHVLSLLRLILFRCFC